ncbi:MAG TPA: AraC family transcriptional regulator [Ruminiclostridium sp.]
MIFYESKSNHFSCWYGNDMVFPPHIHKELELLMVTKGELELTINSTTHTLKQGDISVELPNTIHGYKTLNHCDYFIMIFNGDMLPLHKNIFSTYKPSKSYVPSIQVPNEVYTSLSCIYKEAQLDNNLGIITGYLYLVLGRLLPLLYLQKSQKDINTGIIERILGYIQLNYLNPINLSSIASELEISTFYLSRVFSNNIGLRLDKYINELRINYANYLLLYSDKQITEIAFESGFETLRTFNRAYKEFNSITPREYRKRNNNTDKIIL